MTGDATILIVDDEPDILELIATRLEMAGYSSLPASSGEEGLRAFFAQRPDLALIDINMPGMSGVELCRRIREMSNIPVVFLTALGEEEDRVVGLEAGADDYIVKPFGRNELVARIAAALRRARMPAVGAEPDSYRDAEVAVDFAAHTVTVRGKQVSLSPREFRLLTALVRNSGQVLGHQRLLDLVWGRDSLDTSPESVRLYVSYLRGKVEENPRRPRLIRTVREFGYRYVPPDGDQRPA